MSQAEKRLKALATELQNRGFSDDRRERLLVHFGNEHCAAVARIFVDWECEQAEKSRPLVVIRASPSGHRLIVADDLNSFRRIAEPVTCLAQRAGVPRTLQTDVPRGH